MIFPFLFPFCFPFCFPLEPVVTVEINIGGEKIYLMSSDTVKFKNGVTWTVPELKDVK